MDFRLLDFLQSLPLFLDPVAISIGFFSIRWYAVCFFIGFAVAWRVLSFRARRSIVPCNTACLSELVPSLFLGILLGGRFGYVFFYDPSMLLHPLSIVSPFDAVSGEYVGIRGMSFFGALIGGLVTLALFSRFRDLRFFDLSDLIVPVVPFALFFGRIGNFINGELYGRVTDMPWGMYFPGAPDGGISLRHPSQLYEASLEGVILALILFLAGRKQRRRGEMTFLFIAFYAIFRFFIEFFREPDAGNVLFFGWMTTGQLLSLSALFITSVFLRISRIRDAD